MNLLHDLPEDLQEEHFTTLLKTEHITLERIISKGHITPENEWYDQDHDEWVLLLAGSAQLTFGDGEVLTLKQGDQLIIPAHRRHRVSKTATNQETIWLALHYSTT